MAIILNSATLSLPSGASPNGSVVKNLPANETWVPSLVWEGPLSCGATTPTVQFSSVTQLCPTL